MVKRVPIGRIAALLAVLVAGLVLARGPGTPRFRTVARGVEFAVLRGDPFCRQGSSDIAVVRFDPSQTRTRVRHFASEGKQPLDIFEWQRRSGATVVFNAGQYYPDLSYMGLLVSGGKAVSRRLHPTFKGALVAGPLKGGRAAQVIDLDEHPLDAARPGWLEVAQSFMLFDEKGVVRVKKSSQIAPRTVVGEDSEHRLLVIASEGSYTLNDLAILLKASPLRLTHAMSMDGGGEAQLVVRSGTFHYANFGHWTPGRAEDELRSALAPLPAVVTVSIE